MLNNIKSVFHMSVNVRIFASVNKEFSRNKTPKNMAKIVNKLTELIAIRHC